MHAEQKQEIRVHIRWMIRRDMAEVLQIERESFEFPWIDEDFIRCLRQRNCIGMVAEHEGRVVGFMIYELHRTRIHVLNFAVSRVCHRLGVGSQMIAKLIAKLSAQRRSRIVLEVRETNVDAQLFFRENGFRAVSILHSFYDDTPEDAYLMQYRYRNEKPAEVESLGVHPAGGHRDDDGAARAAKHRSQQPVEPERCQHVGGNGQFHARRRLVARKQSAGVVDDPIQAAVSVRKPFRELSHGF